jgi:imidazolonepropionase-like amidohydrolase
MAAIIRSGAKYAVGTDGLHGRLSQDIRFLADLGASPADALAVATSRAAAVCGSTQEVGTLEPGKRADFIGVSGDPLSDIAAVSHVQTIVARGRLIRQGTTCA